MVSVGPWLEPLPVSMPLLGLTALLPRVSEVGRGAGGTLPCRLGSMEVILPAEASAGLGMGTFLALLLFPVLCAQRRIYKSPCGMTGLIPKHVPIILEPKSSMSLREGLCVPSLLGGYEICSPA